MAKVELDFDLVEVGIVGRVQVAPLCCGADPKCPPIPRVTVPFGLPLILGSLKDDVEKNLLHPEDMPIHDTDRAQQFWPRRMEAENLYSLDTCPVQTTIHVERDSTTGKLLSFKEDFIQDTKITAQNSLSMRRPPGPESQDVKGSGSSYPFWPGGLEEPTLGDLKNNEKDTIELFSEFLTTPPGFEAGMVFTEEGESSGELSKKRDNQTGTSAPDIIKLSDILAQSEEFDFIENGTNPNDTSASLVWLTYKPIRFEVGVKQVIRGFSAK